MLDDVAIAKAKEAFDQETTEHSVEVLKDDGLYRHLRCKRPGSWMYGFNIVTFPGYLVIAGDTGDFMFGRCPDMFEWFLSPDKADPLGSIQADYWSGKLEAGGREICHRYSPELFQKRVMEWLESYKGNLSPTDFTRLKQEVEAQIFAHDFYHEEEARALLDAFEFRGHRISDSYEWDLKIFDHHYLWCCWAIVWAINEYRKAKG